MLTYKYTDHLKITGYLESNFGGHAYIRKPTSWYIFLLTKGTIYWRSNKQTIITSFSIEA